MDFSIIFSAEFWITDSGAAQASVAERLVLPREAPWVYQHLSSTR
jgi:hypothetical protein